MTYKNIEYLIDKGSIFINTAKKDTSIELKPYNNKYEQVLNWFLLTVPEIEMFIKHNKEKINRHTIENTNKVLKNVRENIGKIPVGNSMSSSDFSFHYADNSRISVIKIINILKELLKHQKQNEAK